MRLIDADELKKDFDNLHLFKLWVREEIKAHIDNAPTVDSSDTKYLEERDADAWESGYIQGLTERPQGEWIKAKEERMSIDMSGEIVTRYKCSKCGRVIATFPSKLAEYYPFCHCGADMRKGGAE